MDEKPWPTEIALSPDKAVLTVGFDTGETFRLGAEYLRVLSPSAEVQGHSPEQRKTIGGKRDARITAVEPVGNYAVRLVFDDLHSTGIYAWDYLLRLGRDEERLWAGYLEELAAKGLSREKTRR